MNEQRSRDEIATARLEAAIENFLAARAARALAQRPRWLRRRFGRPAA